jgi:peptide/nickel transport system ATP-binding protein
MPDSGIEICDLRLWLGQKARWTPVLDGISFTIPEAQVTGLAGESGSGKSMTGLCILGLQPPNNRIKGEIRYSDKNMLGLSPHEINKMRGREIAMISQDPSASLHPMLRISKQLTDHYRFHTGASKSGSWSRALEVLERVQVSDPAATMERYPHQFSGGQLQRIAIAGALMCRPRILIADEPTTDLDVTVQAEILRLLRGLCNDMRLGVLLITHDLGVMSALADEVVIMRSGQIVEQGHREKIITRPADPYTRQLIESLPAAQLEQQNQDLSNSHLSGETDG